MSDTTIQDRAAGAIMGAFIGDALGLGPHWYYDLAHYTIGVVFALVLAALAPGDWLTRPTFLPALLYGIGTVVFSFFIIHKGRIKK